jgi:arsenite methyltransferase
MARIIGWWCYHRRFVTTQPVPRGDYGYDAPYALIIFAIVAVVSGAIATVAGWRGSMQSARIAALYCAFFSASTLSFFYTTRRGKFLEWEAILTRVGLRGDERVLDMGCGRGAVLTAVAKRLTTGRATGIDIWSRHDQSGNASDVTVRNAALEGVADRVTLATADMRALPFPDDSFDVVVSSLAIHNINSNDDRRRAVAEGFRVVRPGGRLVIADIRATAIYAGELQARGALTVQRVRLGWRFWWGNPIAATTLVTGSKSRDGSARDP